MRRPTKTALPLWLLYTFAFTSVFLPCQKADSAEGQFQPLPESGWKGQKWEVQGVEKMHPAVVGHPADSKEILKYKSPEALSPGVYRIRLSLIPSHTHNRTAWNSNLKISAPNGRILTQNSWKGIYFTRVNKPETRTLDVVLPRENRLVLKLKASVVHEVFKQKKAERDFEASQEEDEGGLSLEGEEDTGEGLDLSMELKRGDNVYYLLKGGKIKQLAEKGWAQNLSINKLRYEPGENLKGNVTLQRLTRGNLSGKLRLYLEHDIDKRHEVKTERIEFAENNSKDMSFSISLPDRKLGHALIAEFVPDGKARGYEQAAYFNIAENCYRTAIAHVHPITRQTLGGEKSLKNNIKSMRRNYQNLREIFFWAPEDMVELSPDADYWFSGQTAYHLRKKGLQQLIALAHKNGIAMSTYGKFYLSGYLGWKYVFDHPYYNKRRSGGAIPRMDVIDRFKNKEFLVGEGFGGIRFIPVEPDLNPFNVRVAAEEMIRSIKMFNWDAVRWDGHPTADGMAKKDKFSYRDHRMTQTLVRYFKDIVNAEFPDFQHGYNYLNVTADPTYKWAREDYELNELARGGGLLMNETIGNHAGGHTYKWLADNLQVEADLCRERDAFMLGVSRSEVTTRDDFLQAVLYFAGGCRPYGAASSFRRINRYGTRFSKYVFDERMVRITEPEQLLSPTEKTELWWQPFVYETPIEQNSSQLVVNLLNLPAQDKIGESDENLLPLSPGTSPVAFNLNLPEGYTAQKAHIINPFTLDVKTVPIRNNRIRVPPVSIWQVLVMDLTVANETTPLAERLAPPRTLNAERKKAQDSKMPPLFLDINPPMAQAQRKWEDAFIEKKEGVWPAEETFRESTMAEISKKLLQDRNTPENLPQQKSDRPQKNISLTRNGTMDVFLGRGPVDYRLESYKALARNDKISVDEGRIRYHGSMQNNLPPRKFGNYDLIFYENVPFGAIGQARTQTLLPYVEQGGSVLFTGGSCAFGAGGYHKSVLNTELLPVVCVQKNDTRWHPPEKPLNIEPGPDFDELDVSLDFSSTPSFWCWNEVALRPEADVKVFLKSGNRPVLVGRKYGEGRVACLLVAHRGTSSEETTAYFDWQDWPRLLHAVSEWLAPDAEKTNQAEKMDLTAKKIEELKNRLAGDELGGALQALEGEEDNADSNFELSSDTGDKWWRKKNDQTAQELNKQEMNRRLTTLRKLVNVPEKEVSKLLARQLATVAGLPQQLRSKMIERIRQTPPPQEDLREMARKAVNSENAHIRGDGYQMLALCEDSDFPEVFLSEPAVMDTELQLRKRYLAIALSLYEQQEDSLIQKGRELVKNWREEEKREKREFTGGEGFSMAAPEKPMLDWEDLFRRVGWLAYLSRFEPERYGPAFVREYTMLRQYREYMDCKILSLQDPNAPDFKKKQIPKTRAFKRFWYRLNRATAPLAERLFAKDSKAVAEQLAEGRFLEEMKQTFNLLGMVKPEKEQTVLQYLRKNAEHEWLRNVAEARTK